MVGRGGIYGDMHGDGQSVGSPAEKPKSGWDRRSGETAEQHRGRCRHYEFMAFDPDNPDVPLD